MPACETTKAWASLPETLRLFWFSSYTDHIYFVLFSTSPFLSHLSKLSFREFDPSCWDRKFGGPPRSGQDLEIRPAHCGVGQCWGGELV